ncbi:MAG: ABC transporter ATP-binding protein [Angelakisella sp.]|jgi:putative ABC transport system ATP-binding protein|nr:ABC transporter ATP-binding protein [Angelakisella sp.]MCI9666802.1 ABC transporter ATP-binding protein [Angelakisella sp.]
MSLLEVRGLEKIYSARGGNRTAALRRVSFTVEEGEFVAIMGESGSGKSTLLNLLASLDRPTAGEVLLEGKNLAKIPGRRLSAFRRDHLGFVFQDCSLLDTFSLGDNILLPLVLAKLPFSEMSARLLPLAEELGITKLLNKYPWEVSGGQKQRAAAARALITRPSLLLADEPTGALDSRSAGELLDIFQKENWEGQTIVMVTHSVQAACRAQRVLFLQDGQLVRELRNRSGEDFYRQVADGLATLGKGVA